MRLVALFLLLSLVLVDRAHAYIDPGTGSYVLQLALAGLFASLFFVKRIWNGVRSWLGRGTDQESVDSDRQRFGVREGSSDTTMESKSESGDHERTESH